MITSEATILNVYTNDEPATLILIMNSTTKMSYYELNISSESEFINFK